MPDNIQPQDDEVPKDKYERIREELGYDDSDVRALAASVQMKVVGLFGNEKEKKITYLMREREKRDRLNLDLIKEDMRTYANKAHMKELDGLLHVFSNNDDFLQYLDEDKRICKVARHIGKYKDFIGSDLDRLKIVVDKLWGLSQADNFTGFDQLYGARIVYEGDMEMFIMIADYLIKHQIISVVPLVEAKVIIGDDVEMLKSFLDYAESLFGTSNFINFSYLVNASQIYGHDKSLFKIFVDLRMDCLNLDVALLVEHSDLFTINGTVDSEMLKKVMLAFNRLSKWRIDMLAAEKDKYEKDPEMFEILADSLVDKNHHENEQKKVEKFQKVLSLADYCKGDKVKLRLLAEVPDFAERIVGFEDLYGDNADLIKELVEMSKKYGLEKFDVIDQGMEAFGRKSAILKLFVEIINGQGLETASALIEASSIIKKDMRLLPLFADVAKSGKSGSEHSFRGIRELAKAGIAYGGEYEMFSIFAELAKQDRGLLCNAFLECSALYDHDVQKAMQVKNLLMPLWEKHTYDVTEPVAEAKKIFGNNMEKFKKVLGIIEDFAEKHPKTVYQFGFYLESCGSSMEMLESLVDIFVNEGHEIMAALSGLTGIYGEDVKKRNETLALLKTIGKTVDVKIMETIRWLGEVYGVYDEKSLLELIAVLEKVVANAGRYTCRELGFASNLFGKDKKRMMAYVDTAIEAGSAGFTELKDASPIYKDNDNRFWEIVGLIKEFGAGAGFVLNNALSRTGYDDMYDDFVQLIRKQGVDACKVLVSALSLCVKETKLFELFYKFCLAGRSELLSLMVSDDDVKPLFLDACTLTIAQTGGDLSRVDANRVVAEMADAVLDKLYSGKDWYVKIFIIAKLVKQIDGSSQEAKKILDIQGQINVAAVMAKIDSHFEPFAVEEKDYEGKLKLLSMYADFHKEFNGILVPTVWHLYCLLKDPAMAASMSNLNDLNSTREIENIVDVDDLKKRIKEIKEEILLGDVDMEKYKKSELALAVLDDMAKVSASDWKRANRPLRSIVESYEKNEDDIIKNFDPLKYKSGFIPVQEVTESFVRDPALTKEAEKIQEFVKSFVESEGVLMEEVKVMDLIRESLDKKMYSAKNKSLDALESGKSANGEMLSEKGVVFTQKSIAQIDALTEQLANIASLEDLVHILLKNKIGSLDLEGEVRAIFYYLGAKRQNLAEGESWINSDPSLVDASKIGEFLSDTILLEVVQGKSYEGGADVKLDKNERKTLKMFFVSLLNFLNQKQAEERAYKDRVATSVRHIAVLAGRGLLAELSGFYCDACWTGQSDILHKNPTMVGHTFVDEFENKERSKIIGGCLTLESSIDIKDKNSGKEESAKVLVVRGLNPQNAYINKYKVDDFVENFLDYVQESARKLGAEYVVLPLYTTGALSNRPQILHYLRGKYGDVERVSLSDDINFNGYAIKDSCVVVRVVKENARKGKLPKPSNVPLEQQDRWIGSW